MGSILVQSNGKMHGKEPFLKKANLNNVHDLITQTSKKHGSNIAIICGESQLTYADLEEHSNNLARALVHRDVGPRSLIAICLDRSVDVVVAILGVWKAGAAYVPIEPSLPKDRISQMLENSRPKFIITHSVYPVHLQLDTISEYLSIEVARQSHGVYNQTFPKVTGGDLAYVMYTSGSTGRPKGVEVTHGSIVNLLNSMKSQPGCTKDDRLLAITTISFDMAVPELLLPLICGATSVIARRQEIQDMHTLIKMLERHLITILQGTPAIFRMLLDSGWHARPRLRQIWCGGEALPKALASRLLDHCDTMWNLYGPTEATVYASMWEVQEGQEIIIGSPIPNGHLYVLDEHLSPVPFGQIGELYIGGAGVAKGYHKNDELSRTRFVPDRAHGGSMYRTGDAARYIGPRQVSVLGRLDGQIKIRGHRVEPGDIEAAMTAMKGISAAAVIYSDDRLVGYYVRRNQHEAQDRLAEANRFDKTLRSFLVKHLPAYMIPAFFVELPTLPITPNGKVDRKALPDAVDITTNKKHESQSSQMVAKVLDIWANVLGHRRFGIDDNFFEVGGDSLRLVRLQRQLELAFGLSISAHILFENYTVNTLVEYLEGSPESLNGQPQNANSQMPSDFQERIAIVSTACRLPGGIETAEDFWQLLYTGGDVITTLPQGRWETGHANLDDHLKCQKGGFISPVNDFDLSFFGISPREGSQLDSAQYMMLETSWEAFERAGYTMEQLRGSQTGVFVGTSNILSHQSLNNNAVHDLESLNGYTVTGSAAATMSGRISYHLGLQGPAMTVDTACSSSLVATHLACNALRLRECETALVGGVSLMLNPGLHIEFERLQGMSPDGRCRAFSDDAQGTGWSEGCAAVILKRLSDAQRDGDVIHGVIRGSAVNHDGRSASLTAPSGRAQQQLIERALAAARLHPKDIDYIEAHGTATKLGDPIEANAIAKVFGKSRGGIEPLLIGSAKSNIGHTQAAAGLFGILKVILAMKHAILPESIHIRSPTTAVDWSGSNMSPVKKRQSWNVPERALRRAGVSAFGIGGTNGHVIIEEGMSHEEVERVDEVLNEALPFLLSGDTDATVRAQAQRLLEHLRGETRLSQLQDIAFTLAARRSHLRKRSIVWAMDRQELSHNLQALSQNFGVQSGLEDTSQAGRNSSKLVMLFTGQGSQWRGMGRDLYERYPVFQASLDKIAVFFSTVLEVPLLDVMWAKAGSPNEYLLSTTEYAQPGIFALEASLWRLWQDWGITPDFVLGHSLGELTAAYVAGILELSDACRLVAARGKLMQAQSGYYQMAAVEASAEETDDTIMRLALRNTVEIAVYNAPVQIVVSGKKDSVQAVMDHFEAQGRKVSVIVDGHAFHSRYVDNMLDEYAKVVESVRLHNTGKIQVASSVKARIVHKQELVDPLYWVNQAREPVRFCESVQTLAALGANIFLELGPDQVLCGIAAASLHEGETVDVTWLSTMKRNEAEGGVARQLKNASALHLSNLNIDWKAVLEPYGGTLIDLPTYAFQRNYTACIRRQKSAKLALRNSPESNDNEYTRSIEDRFTFQVRWVPTDSHSHQVQATWGLIVFASDIEWVLVTTEALTKAGVRLLKVEDFELAQDFEGVVCLWDSPSGDGLRSSELMAKALSQLQTVSGAQSRLLLLWITHQAVGTSTELDDREITLGIGPLLWGLMRTARSEQPHLDLRLIDVGHNTVESAIVSAAMLTGEPEIAVRRDSVLVPRLERSDAVKHWPVARRLVRTDGAVLITGGLGHLGACLAERLVERHGVKDIVLASRRGLNTENDTKTIGKLTALGAEVTVVACDAADSADINRVLGLFNTQRPLRGIIHAAGVSEPGVLTSMTPDRCEKVIAPKAHGAWFLHDATKDLDLDIFVLYSSLSGILGLPGLANYAAASTYLDALAHLRRAQGLPATSMAYGTLGNRGGDGFSACEEHTLTPIPVRSRHIVRGRGPRTPGDSCSRSSGFDGSCSSRSKSPSTLF